MAHPNIIVTHILHNKQGDEFFVEEYIPDILKDSWRARIQEAANLLHDISDALAYLHKPPLSLVHGDVKPDNIAKRKVGTFFWISAFVDRRWNLSQKLPERAVCEQGRQNC